MRYHGAMRSKLGLCAGGVVAMLSLALLPLTPGCGGRTLQAPGSASGEDPADTGSATEPPSETLQPCDDGTGASNCCPMEAVAGGECATTGLLCWTRCLPPSDDGAAVFHGQLACTGSMWIAGHGLFPCH
jgi:hypothetical protein